VKAIQRQKKSNRETNWRTPQTYLECKALWALLIFLVKREEKKFLKGKSNKRTKALPNDEDQDKERWEGGNPYVSLRPGRRNGWEGTTVSD